MKVLAILLFHNDEDIVKEQIEYMISNNHDIIIFDYSSTDNIYHIIHEFKSNRIIEKHIISSNILYHNNNVFKYIDNYINKYMIGLLLLKVMNF